jgi:hypothetical protein
MSLNLDMAQNTDTEEVIVPADLQKCKKLRVNKFDFRTDLKKFGLTEETVFLISLSCGEGNASYYMWEKKVIHTRMQHYLERLKNWVTTKHIFTLIPTWQPSYEKKSTDG